VYNDLGTDLHQGSTGRPEVQKVTDHVLHVPWGERARRALVQPEHDVAAAEERIGNVGCNEPTGASDEDASASAGRRCLLISHRVVVTRLGDGAVRQRDRNARPSVASVWRAELAVIPLERSDNALARCLRRSCLDAPRACSDG
jgi:hypothetical protein